MCSENILWITPVFSSLWRLILWRSIWSMLVNVSDVLKTWCVLWLLDVGFMDVKMVNSGVQIFCVLTEMYLLVLLVTERKVLETMIEDLSLFCHFCFMYFKALLLGACVFRIFVFLDELILLSLTNCPICPWSYNILYY